MSWLALHNSLLDLFTGDPTHWYFLLLGFGLGIVFALWVEYTLVPWYGRKILVQKRLEANRHKLQRRHDDNSE